jgi:hypothetical protein
MHCRGCGVACPPGNVWCIQLLDVRPQAAGDNTQRKATSEKLLGIRRWFGQQDFAVCGGRNTRTPVLSAVHDVVPHIEQGEVGEGCWVLNKRLARRTWGADMSPPLYGESLSRGCAAASGSTPTRKLAQALEPHGQVKPFQQVLGAARGLRCHWSDRILSSPSDRKAGLGPDRSPCARKAAECRLGNTIYISQTVKLFLESGRDVDRDNAMRPRPTHRRPPVSTAAHRCRSVSAVEIHRQRCAQGRAAYPTTSTSPIDAHKEVRIRLAGTIKHGSRCRSLNRSPNFSDSHMQ